MQWLYYEGVSNDWSFKVIDTSANMQTYLAERKDKSKAIKIELPKKKGRYDFGVLRNPAGEELLVFRSDAVGYLIEVAIKELFGYIVIK